MEINKRDVGWKLWIQWILAYTFTYVLYQGGGFLASLNVSTVMYYGEKRYFLISLADLFMTGLITGFIQWLILRTDGISLWWFITGILLPIFGGIIVVILQTLILWKRVFYAGVWIVANGLTLYIHDNVSIYMFNYLTKYNRLVTTPPLLMSILSQNIFLVRYITTGLLGGIITASVLVWLLRHPKPELTSQPE
jgi:hypothetical protein